MAMLPVSHDVKSSKGYRARLADYLRCQLQPLRVASAVGHFLRPDILTPRKAVSKHAATAYLDGLRGWAALLVLLLHLTVYTHNEIERCYGYELFPNYFLYTPATLPIVRLLFSGGHFAVAVFFVISGYVLTQRLLGQLHADRSDDFLRSINSAIVRRPFRVYLPVVWSTFLFATIWHVTGVQTPWPPRASNLLFEYWSWFRETCHFLFFFRSGYLFTYYNIHTWTIAIEMRGSMFLYVWLFVFRQVPHRLRILFTAANLFHLINLSSGAWFACFFAGMLTAELHLLYADTCPVDVRLPWDGILRALTRRKWIYQPFMHLLLVVALFLGSQPTGDETTIEQTLGHCRGWSTLGKLIPHAYDKHSFRWFWLFYAAWFMVLCSREIAWLKAFFECRFSQYLGRHSFALYLCHGPMIGILSERLFWLTGVWSDADVLKMGSEAYAKFGHLHYRWLKASWWPFPPPDQYPYGLEPNFLFCVAISVPTILYVAELGTKLFDNPSITASRWAFDRFDKLKEQPKEGKP